MIKAIETRYKGYRFRSRLEARWAVFFDSLEIGWEYEKEGYDLGGQWYLPDFWLPVINGGCWIEIKGRPHDQREAELCRKLCEATGNTVFLFDAPMVVPIDSTDAPRGHGWAPIQACSPVAWHHCYLCEGISIGRIGLYDHCEPESLCPHGPGIREAYAAALSARFEHGEQP